MQQGRHLVGNEVRGVSSLKISQTDRFRESASSSRQKLQRKSNLTLRFLLQFGVKTALRYAAAYVRSKVKKMQRFRSCRIVLQKGALRDSFPSRRNALQERAFI